MKSLPASLSGLLESQHSLITCDQARQAGLSPGQLQRLAQVGVLVRIHRCVYRLTGSRPTPETWLLAACLATGSRGVASHSSACWLWGMWNGPPPGPTVTVPIPAHPELAGVTVHRSTDLGRSGIVTWRGIPVTNPLRTIVDLAAVSTDDVVDEAVDRALARRLVTVPGLEAELARLSRKGRRGVGILRHDLHRRGFVGAPAPSVLESRSLRLLAAHGIVPLAVELRVTDVDGDDRAGYRIDIAITELVGMEVDGHAYHSTPEALRHDVRRHNALRLQGLVVLRFTWRDILHDGDRVVSEVRAAVAAVHTRPTG